MRKTQGKLGKPLLLNDRQSESSTRLDSFPIMSTMDVAASRRLMAIAWTRTTPGRGRIRRPITNLDVPAFLCALGAHTQKASFNSFFPLHWLIETDLLIYLFIGIGFDPQAWP
ncbi:hypothetical protein M422DRAFT_276295 [Sphaerobolus stellatus SS14]|uniref:Uncharacterized protein n=1 Tax=Sphaerobolus stellatus (strain SS14) TaxID=990650 RepID=A0A0C9T2Y3_SPHS4|nr:hypothetical protein M422DRAFT_276295 [Sphaerobolus stellatus SS14]